MIANAFRNCWTDSTQGIYLEFSSRPRDSSKSSLPMTSKVMKLYQSDMFMGLPLDSSMRCTSLSAYLTNVASFSFRLFSENAMVISLFCRVWTSPFAVTTELAPPSSSTPRIARVPLAFALVP
ncbi:hypothetical protein H113_02228 [Trichophyton rubrum MR1459]|uniref:Uncharacterized protein n=1 Tax=Trichophyton rubrum (strain ATCC MYA-4607 / CBS 118892) TaxID=559305 RepID=A0A080WLF4_TRIRC|nr:uncharacterized protein TERG_12493 [Trichophyton rubrum CBS 118892]EZF97895.1 hypothetical protein H113_02228 [Trichophyton rubrum MR1459]EZG08909.1 hypothetical protein H106_02088 [Trichophyton rubrum CBS 735.88]KFL62539.1 hypothetical protein TERG_12493 [Trichophyton rubrum CBS 118892]